MESKSTMSRSRGQVFWDRFAERYAARQIKDVAAYEALIADAASRPTPDDTVLELGCGTGAPRSGWRRPWRNSSRRTSPPR